MATLGYLGLDALDFGTDADAPYLQNRSPAPSSVDQPAASVYLEIVDDDTGVNLATVHVEVNVDGGGWQDAYVSSAFADPYDDGSVQGVAVPNGYSFDIVPDVAFPLGAVVQVRVTAEDNVGNPLVPVTYQFQTAVPPYVSCRDPPDGATSVAVNAQITVSVKDDGLGPDDQETEVDIGGVLAFDANGGGFQAGFNGTYTETVPGLEWTVVFTEHPVWSELEVVSVRVRGADLNGLTVDETKSFTTAEAVYPEGYGDTGGLIPAITRAIGYADDIAGGMRATRLTAAVTAGDTEFEVETTHDWPTPGKISVDGVVYDYAGFASPTLTGITHLAGGVAVPGAKVDHRNESTVVDLSQTYSALNQLRRAMLVDYAEGEDLAVIGRNLGVTRYPELEDQEQYRALIKALAYNPKATMYGIGLMLDALLGAGNYELWDDPESYPHIVFVKIGDTLAALDIEWGKTYLAEPLAVPATSDTTADLPATPTSVTGVRWADENLHTETLTARPSAQVITDYEGDPGTSPWEFVGGTEATEVSILTADSGCIAWETTATAYYKHPSRIVQETELRGVGLLATIGASAVLDAAKADQACLIVRDGARAYGWGVVADTGSTYALGLFNPDTGAIVGSTVVLDRGVYHDLELRVSDGKVRLFADLREVLAEDYTGFPVSALHQVDFGVLAAGLAGAPHLRVKRARVGLRTSTDYWASGAAAGSVATADPDRLTVVKASAFVDPDDGGKKLTVRGGTAVNSYGGTNNGDFEVAVVATAQIVELRGAARTGARVTSLDSDLFNAEDDEAFLFPRDLGKKVVITSGDAAGTYYVKQLLHVITGDDLASRDTLTEERTGLAVLEVSPGTPAAFSSEQELEWRLDPNFVNESGLTWLLSDAGSWTGATVTLRDALPISSSSYERVLTIRRAEVNSAQLLSGRDAENVQTQVSPPLFRYYPFYLADPLGYLRRYLELVTAAGVHPEIVTE